jgi:chromosome segregation ATPase
MIVLQKVESLDSLEDTKTQLNLLIDKFNEIEERETVRDVGMFEEISHFRRESREGLQRLERKFEGLESKLGNVENKLGNLENKLGNVDDKLGNVDDKLGNVDDKLGNVDDKLGNVDDKLGNVENKFEDLESKVDANTLAIQSLEKVTQGGFDNIGKLLQEISNKLG